MLQAAVVEDEEPDDYNYDEDDFEEYNYDDDFEDFDDDAESPESHPPVVKITPSVSCLLMLWISFR